MDLDNPSYFSVRGQRENEHNNGLSNIESTSSTSDCSLSRQSTSSRKHKRGLRGFLRSVSSNSADSNQELLILGEPRLSDIAPDLAFAARPQSYKTKVASPAISEQAASELSEDEVFISQDKNQARYYNFCNKIQANSRRHSFGNFSGGRERSNSASSSISLSFKDDFCQAVVDQEPTPNLIDDHSIRHASYPRKRCPRCTKVPTKKYSNMDDILIVSLKSSEAASLWVNYFISYFEQISKHAKRKPFKIQYLCVEDYICESKENIKYLTERCAGVKLQLVVFCPNLLEFTSEYSQKCQDLGNLFIADRTLSLLLGVSDNDLTDLHKKIFPNYFQWRRLSVGQDQDENFTKEFLGQAMTILSQVWKQQNSLGQDKCGFSVSSKKIREGQNSLFILLTHPLQKDDIVKVSIERNNELFEVTSLKRRNPYTVKITIPESLTEVTAIVNILVEKNGNIVGSRPIKCESRLRELEQILRLTNDPIDFMCQTVGFAASNRDHLDSYLLQTFKKNQPHNFNLLANHDANYSPIPHHHTTEDFPTLLHFAAKYGLEKLAVELMDAPGGDVAYDMRNSHDMTPAEIAEANGHLELGATLRGYMSITQFTKVYAELQEISSNAAVLDNPNNHYSIPKNFSEFYKTCPAPKPISTHKTDKPATTPIADLSTPSGYTSMTTPVSCERKTFCATRILPKTPSPIPKLPHAKNDTCQDKAQQELLEIINDFKNNVHSISQAEKLVEEWKNRNDVKKSLKDKQEQLHEMRMNYDKIQHTMKASMKKSNMEWLKKMLFGKAKVDEEKLDISMPLVASSNIVIVQAQRPISSLSTSSSESSGRMSSISASSLGDSGTHSDNEERKNLLELSQIEPDFRNVFSKVVQQLNASAPMPSVSKPLKSGSFLKRSIETIQERPLPRPDTLSINEEYYIRFPKNGLPVSSVSSNGNPLGTMFNPGAESSSPAAADYMNLAESNNHEYMNFKPMDNK